MADSDPHADRDHDWEEIRETFERRVIHLGSVDDSQWDPSEASEAPVDSSKMSVNSSEVPVNSSEAPVDSSQTSVNSADTSVTPEPRSIPDDSDPAVTDRPADSVTSQPDPELICPNDDCGLAVSTATAELGTGERCPECGRGLLVRSGPEQTGGVGPDLFGFEDRPVHDREPDVIPMGPNVRINMEQVRAATSESNPNRTETNHSIIGRLDLEDGVSVAIKKGYYGDLSEDGRSGDVRDIRRLRREIDNLRRVVDNPYVVDLVDYADEDDHEPWLAMEYMDGGDLRTVTGELSLRRALWTALCIVDAIDYVHHECHVAHRDLKPRNILLRSTDDGWDVPKIADWGTARVMTKDPSIDRVGTSRYAAPEQTNDIQEPTGRKTDIFQLSIVLYELFVGEHPYGETIHEVNKNRLSTPTRPSKKLPGLPTALDDLLLRGMENHPDDRPRAERFNYVLGRLYSDLIGS